MRSITCTNNKGYSVTFSTRSFTPFLLAHVDGIYGFENNLSISTNSMTDGGTFQGSVAKPREITLTILDRPEHDFGNAQQYRDILYLLFSKDDLGTLVYTENDVSRQINYRVERMTVGSANKRLYFVYLICEDPFFYATESETKEIASIIPLFEFPHEFYQYEVISYKSQERLAQIENINAQGGIGMEITLLASDVVVNPSVVHVEDNLHMQVGSDAKPFTMAAGDVLVITTGTNNKHVFLTQDGATVEVNQYITEDSEFIQLNEGMNTIGYEADTGEDNLRVRISYRLKYSGV